MRYEVANNLVIDAGATEFSHSVELDASAVAFDVSTVRVDGTSGALTVHVEGSNDLAHWISFDSPAVTVSLDGAPQRAERVLPEVPVAYVRLRYAATGVSFQVVAAVTVA